MAAVESNCSGRWETLRTLMGRSTDFGMETGALDMMDGAMAFEPDADLQDMVSEAKILCVGAGGLGCEILKNLALTGFRDIHVIDLDTIDLTNLNRQFLFRKNDIGKPKAEVAAEFIKRRVPGCNVTPHFGKLQDFDADWYKEFSLVIAGLDNIEARRWLNDTLCGIVDYSPHAGNGSEGGVEIDRATVIPMIDGGTEGLKGQTRVILPKITSCFECTTEFMPKNKGKAMCTLENNPRQPDDCAMYVYVKASEAGGNNSLSAEITFTNNESVLVQDTKKHGIVLRSDSEGDGASVPTYEVKLLDDTTLHHVAASNLLSVQQQWARDFGSGADIDKDSREHMTWLHERASARASMFKISGLTYEKTIGTVKNIIPAVASTNAIIAATCCHEAYKCLTMSGQLCNTYWLYNGTADVSGVDSNVQFFEKDPECDACREPKNVTVPSAVTVQEFVDTYIKAPGMFEKVSEDDVRIPLETAAPQLYSQTEGLFYVANGPLAASMASNLSFPLKNFVGNDGKSTVLKVSDKQWGKKFMHVNVIYEAS